MKIEQAIYGEVRSGHALRLASTRSQIVDELASRLDLPDTAPPGVNWSPYITGFPYGDRYVLARTFADPHATRAGMVISHALIAPLDEIVTTDNLKSLLGNLIVTPETPGPLTTLDIQRSAEPPTVAIDLTATAESLVTRGVGPTVKIGIDGFEDLIVALWFHLWPDLRANFSFRLSFGPHDIVDNPPPVLVCTPSTLEARWTGRNIISVSGSKNISRAAAILCDRTEANPILQFADEVGICVDRFTHLQMLVSAYELSSTPDFEACTATIRLVDTLSPDPTVGTVGKEKLIRKLCSQMCDVGIAGVLQLRNLKIIGFDGAECIWESLRARVATYRLEEVDDRTFLHTISDALSAEAVIPWCEAILSGITASACSTSSTFPLAFWRWAHIQPSTLAKLFEHLPSDYDLEARLSKVAPLKMNTSVGNTVMTLARSKRWLRLHGVAVGACFVPREAVQQQLIIDTDLTHLYGIREALRRATSQELVTIALEIYELRILCLAAEEVAHHPQLLKDTDFSEVSAQELWARALAINIDAWQGPRDPKHSLLVVLQSLLDGRQISSDLLDALSNTPVANLCGYERCVEVWPRLIEPARTHFLKATAAGWLEKAALGSVVVPDSQLEATLLAGQALDQMLQTLSLTDAKKAMQLIEILPEYGESRFLQWLEYWLSAHRAMTFAEAELLGNLIHNRHWQRAVDYLVHLAREELNQVKPVLKYCRNMLKLIDIWLLGIAVITNDEKWQVLEDFAADLYSGGPDSCELWERAGGRNSQLVFSGTGRARWHDALSQMRKGRSPQITRLLEVMMRDFPANRQLHHLAKDPVFKTSL
ncbi:GAP1-N1 domain-containing protein [Shewanella sp. ZOR0012]|uniref:GAP1-N1 domain-containing protein n=1 Tax=Shewanella sp. ZOR0012 TaxID=1339231 RepID=UPI00064872DB|nr:effector-associated domain EAD1-containing protein [Shewanella sp. ZOR0012]